MWVNVTRAAARQQRLVRPETAARAALAMEREDLLDQAVHDGRIGSNLRTHYARCFDADPDGTRVFLRKLSPVRAEEAVAPTVPVGEEEYPDSWLTPQERNRITAAGEGRQHSAFVS